MRAVGAKLPVEAHQQREGCAVNRQALRAMPFRARQGSNDAQGRLVQHGLLAWMSCTPGSPSIEFAGVPLPLPNSCSPSASQGRKAGGAPARSSLEEGKTAEQARAGEGIHARQLAGNRRQGWGCCSAMLPFQQRRTRGALALVAAQRCDSAAAAGGATGAAPHVVAQAPVFLVKQLHHIKADLDVLVARPAEGEHTHLGKHSWKTQAAAAGLESAGAQRAVFRA